MKRYIRSAEDMNSVSIIPHYALYSYYGFSVNTRNQSYSLDDAIAQFDKITGDTNSRYCALLRRHCMSSSEYDEIYFSDNLEDCRRVGQDWIQEALDYDSASRESEYGRLESSVREMHYFVDVIDTETGECIYYADAWDDQEQGWEDNI